MPKLFPRAIPAIRSIASGYLILEFDRISKRGKFQTALGGGEYSSLVREVAIIWVVQRILNEVPNEHLDAVRRICIALEIIGRCKFVVDIVTKRVFKGDIGVVVQAVERSTR